MSLEYGQVCVNVLNEGFVYDVSFVWLCALSRLCVNVCDEGFVCMRCRFCLCGWMWLCG